MVDLYSQLYRGKVSVRNTFCRIRLFRFWTFQKYFQPVYQLFIEWILIFFKLKREQQCKYVLVCFMQLLNFALCWFRWELLFPVAMFYQSVKDRTPSPLNCIPGWMICGDMLLLLCIAAIIPLNSASDPSSTLYGVGDSWMKMQPPVLAVATCFLQWFYVTLNFCVWLLNKCWRVMRKPYYFSIFLYSIHEQEYVNEKYLENIILIK